jgi:hypothetical protein
LVLLVDDLQSAGYEAMVHNVVGLTHPEIGQSVGVAGHELTIGEATLPTNLRTL